TSSTPSITVTHGAPSLSVSTVSVGTGTVQTGSTITVTVTAKDAAGNLIAGLGNSAVTIALSGGTATFSGVGPLHDNNDGTYSITLTGVNVGTDTLTASISGNAITSSTPSITVTVNLNTGYTDNFPTNGPLGPPWIIESGGYTVSSNHAIAQS